MLITDINELEKYSTPHRLWQGIPGIEVTRGGRIFAVFYSGGTTEQFGNFAVLIRSVDGGESFSEPIAVAFKEEGRCYDAVLWIDPLGRLWFTWSYASLASESGVYGAICDDPDADELVFGDVFFIGKYVMMNKPTVLSTGEWLFSIAAWDPSLKFCGLPPEDHGFEKVDTGAFVYRCVDRNTKFEKLGGVVADKRNCDEHIVVERLDGSLWMLIRTAYGIASSYSYDGGKTWTPARDSGIKSPSSRFAIRRLRSGRLLMINHHNFTGRNNLTAFISEDDGKTWPYTLLLDSRERVSYPDFVESEDGYIYLVYDRERGSCKKVPTLDLVMADAREILLSKFTENDVLSGKIVDTGSRLGIVISKLTGHADDPNPFLEPRRFTHCEVCKMLADDTKPLIERWNAFFDAFGPEIEAMTLDEGMRLDKLLSLLTLPGSVSDAVSLVRSKTPVSERVDIVSEVTRAVRKNISRLVGSAALRGDIGLSGLYVASEFKKRTGVGVVDYSRCERLAEAKRRLINGESVEAVAAFLGFENAEMYAKEFLEADGRSLAEFLKIIGR